MPIKWHPAEVSKSLDGIEQAIEQAKPYLAEIKKRTEETTKLPDLPEYILQHLFRITDEANRQLGGTQFDPVGRMTAALQSTREAIPKNAKVASPKLVSISLF